jgi:hypothetical protein
MSRFLYPGFILLCSGLLPNHSSAQNVLPALNIPASNITVSGISSGGYMAQQLHSAFSDRFSAVAIIAGGPFYCAENNLTIALTRCIKPNEANKPNIPRLLAITEQFAANGEISQLSNMKNDRVWIFSSADDSVVYQSISDSLVAYYSAFVEPNNIRYINNVGGEHSMPTDDFGFPCEYLGQSSNTEDHFINNCGYDAAGSLLAFSYNHIKSPKNEVITGRLVKFDQSSYISDPNSHGLSQSGYAYIPEVCENTKGRNAKLPRCKLHIALHGCLQSADRISTAFVENAGYNDWADRNRMIILYPQATASLAQGNGNGCWDWWGYDDQNYATRFGNQMNVILQMVDRLTANDSNTKPTPAPQNLQVSIQGIGNILIAWDAQNGVEGYAVYRSKDAEGPYFLVSADVIVEPHLKLDQQADSVFYYVVVGVAGDGGEGLPSKQLAVSVPAIVPSL